MKSFIHGNKCSFIEKYSISIGRLICIVLFMISFQTLHTTSWLSTLPYYSKINTLLCQRKWGLFNYGNLICHCICTWQKKRISYLNWTLHINKVKINSLIIIQYFVSLVLHKWSFMIPCFFFASFNFNVTPYMDEIYNIWL